MRILGWLALFCVITFIPPPPKAHAQQAPLRGKLLVTVNDPSGAIIPGATITVAPQEGSTQGSFTAPVTTAADGLATVEGLVPGRYTIQAEFPGFEIVQIRDFRIRAGDNKRIVTLPLKKVSESVQVGRDKQSASLDPKGNAFSTILTREQIEALPDDPEEMEAVLKAMSPPGATIRVDGFTGGRLPPKSQIRSIRLPRMDQLAAQNHGGANGLMFIDILTQPGNGPLRGSIDGTFRDDALNAKNPFTPVKGLEQLHQVGLAVSGTVVPNKSSFSFNGQGTRQLESNNLLAAVPAGGDPTEVAAPVVQPTDRSMFTARFDQATTKDRMVRASFTRTTADRRNLGVGSYDLPERAYASTASDNTLRVSENGPIGRKFFSESRLQVHWSDTIAKSSTEAMTIRVLDAFTNGGAQQAGGREVRDFEAATDLDYVRGSHSYRVGALLEGGRYAVNDNTNYFGTYTFASLDDYNAGRPSNFTRRVGDPDVTYRNLQLGLYAQDDYRIARSLLLSYGVRYEAQSLIPDQNNWSPRGTITWSPFRNGKTTVRGGWGFFTDWLGTGVYEQTQRLDGVRQREVNVQAPSYPVPGLIGTSPPANRYELGSNLILPESTFANAGVDQQVGSALRLGATYTYRRGTRALRGLNLNPPAGGVRPDADFANVVSVQDDAASRAHLLGVNASYILLNWRQTFFSANYTLASSEANTTGAFGLPATGQLDTEWGVTMPTHRLGASFNTQPIRNLSVGLNVRAQSGTPYNVTTGRDDNQDGLFTDRPAGVSRNSVRTATQWDLGMRLSYAIGFGPARSAGGGGGGGQTVVMVGGGGGGGGMAGGFGGGAADRRFRLEFYVSAQNVTNHPNYVGYSGVMTSPFFGQPTNVLNPRKVEIGTRVGF